MLTVGSVLLTVLSITFVLICAFMILVVLIQKPKGGGLSGAFGGGGGGGSQAVFGAKVGDFLTWFTVALFALFLVVAIVLVFLSRSEGEATAIEPAEIAQPEQPPPATPDETPAGEPVPTGDPQSPEEPVTQTPGPPEPQAPEAPAD